MNEERMTALGSAVTAAEEALAAAQAGNFTEARQLLAIMEEHLEQGQGGNAAHGARRRKVLKLEAEVRALLPEEEAPAPAEPEAAPTAPENLPLPAPQEAETAPPAAETPVTPEAPAAPVLEATGGKAKGPRGVAPPQHLSAEAWARVGAALRAGGVDAGERDAEAAVARQDVARAQEARDPYRAKVSEARALQAEVDAAALRGEVDEANRAWDRLFDVTTAIRGAEGKARRGGTPDPQKAADYTQARLYRLRVSGWARGQQAA